MIAWIMVRLSLIQELHVDINRWDQFVGKGLVSKNESKEKNNSIEQSQIYISMYTPNERRSKWKHVYRYRLVKCICVQSGTIIIISW